MILGHETVPQEVTGVLMQVCRTGLLLRSFKESSDSVQAFDDFGFIELDGRGWDTDLQYYTHSAYRFMDNQIRGQVTLAMGGAIGVIKFRAHYVEAERGIVTGVPRSVDRWNHPDRAVPRMVTIDKAFEPGVLTATKKNLGTITLHQSGHEFFRVEAATPINFAKTYRLVENVGKALLTHYEVDTIG